ncbi:glycosyl hydrolase family 71-domain-containing protein [Aspergillus pseudocaelatus]|uniref:Glycosyl hydrolase family 71-domain-containing protein n=1 Tax=Aspergillus pseudocaelatus TaxID=1825620 RepID=A0ABQ6WRH6_9EURO|nr:glycosyl hydrolase family 71-domain-containing protein [Aspergillus pseudocaelatus]
MEMNTYVDPLNYSKGDNLWYDQWQKIWYLKPLFVQIISWNDYGESHYIGPLPDYAMEAFDFSRAPYNYVTDMSHDGWRLFLPSLIDKYNYEKTTIDKEGLTDHIISSAILSALATITVSIGGVTQQASWTCVPFGSSLGDVAATLSRSKKQIAQVSRSFISTNCAKGLTNGMPGNVSMAPGPITAGLCEFGCNYGYCPLGAYGHDASYSGLCVFDCPHGFCPDTACNTVSAPLSTPTVSPFLPPACIGGTGDGNLAGLCALHTLPEATGKVGEAGPGMDEAIYGPLCAFTCKYGYCPEGTCAVSTSGGGGGGKDSGEVYVDPGIFLKPSPVVGRIPPCTLIMPDLLLNTPTTIHYIQWILTSTTVSYFNMPVDAGQTRPSSFYLTPSYSPEPLTLEAGGTSTTLFLPPVAYQSVIPDGGVTQTPTSFGTIEYYTNCETYTYSEAQFPSLSDLATSTATSTTSTTVVPPWVQAGGFYWSPVSQPTSKPSDIPVPPLPSFPPIPTAPYTFISNAPSSTCTDTNNPGCGHRCTSNCGSSSSDECTAQTATNYWVNCSGTSCFTTTTGKYCLTGVKLFRYGGRASVPNGQSNFPLRLLLRHHLDDHILHHYYYQLSKTSAYLRRLL